jgi:hypothetical protein
VKHGACFTALGLTLASLFGAACPASASVPEYVDDAEGRPYRVAFDPGDGLALAPGVAFGEGHDVAPAPYFQGEIRVRTVGDDDGSSARWDVAHTILPWSFTLPTGEQSRTTLGLYRVLARRHSRAPSLVLPTLPPTRLPFPFDLALSLDLAQLELRGRDLASGPAVVRDVTVIDGALLLDPLRNGPRGVFFGFGVAARYDVSSRDVGGEVSTVHALAPFTAGALRLSLEDARGLTRFELRGEVVPAWRTDGTFRLAADAHGELERTLLAVNDVPVVLGLSGDYRYRPDDPLFIHEGRGVVSLGVRLFP